VRILRLPSPGTISELAREHELVADLTSRARTALAKADVPLMTELARQIAAILAPLPRWRKMGCSLP
jgi:hypothetical protein